MVQIQEFVRGPRVLAKWVGATGVGLRRGQNILQRHCARGMTINKQYL